MVVYYLVGNYEYRLITSPTIISSTSSFFFSELKVNECFWIIFMLILFIGKCINRVLDRVLDEVLDGVLDTFIDTFKNRKKIAGLHWKIGSQKRLQQF